jgi:hypothetical protein
MIWVFNSNRGFENMIFNNRHEDKDDVIYGGKDHKDIKIRWSQIL